MRVQKYRRLDEVRDFSRAVSGNELQLKESRRRWQCKIVNNAQQFEILPTPEYRSSELKQSLKTYPLLACNRRGHASFPTIPVSKRTSRVCRLSQILRPVRAESSAMPNFPLLPTG